MSTFNGILKEFPGIQIDNFRLYENHRPPLACFLSHIHSDHLTNLENIHSPFVYCTAPTRELVLRLEKYPHRMNFAKGIIEVTKQTYRRVKNLLKAIPLETPTVIELTHGYSIQVTLFDANHCTGACMFLIEGDGKAILYTGDIRSELWWVNSLARNPAMIPFSSGQKRLDNIYLDTTFAMGDALKMDFPPKADGLAELLAKVSKYPDDTVFYLDAWTFGYEEVWIAICKALKTQVHLCDYRYKVYSSMKNVPACFGPHSAALLGFQLGNGYHEGCLTREASQACLHSCERGTSCAVFDNLDVVRITPIITRHNGTEIAEVGPGGGQGDLGQNHELELGDVVAVAKLIGLCKEQLKSQPEVHAKIVGWLDDIRESGGSAAKLDFDGFWKTLKDGDDDDDPLDDLPLDRLVPALVKLFTGGLKEKEPVSTSTQSNHITFPFSRHASYNELRCLVEAFRPRDIFPCTVDPARWSEDISMKTLFGDLCSADIWSHDQRMLAMKRIQVAQESQPASQKSSNSSPEPSTPVHKRRMSPVESENPDFTPILTKRTKSIALPGIWQSRSTSPDDFKSPKNATVGLTTPQHGVLANRHGEVRTSANIHTPLHAIPDIATPGSNPHDRAAYRASITRAVEGNMVWQGLRCVSGYHNQKPEKEL